MASSSPSGAASVPPAQPAVEDINAARAPPAPEQLAAFKGLVEKVVTALALCRYARSQELSGRAAAQAEALYRGDSLVVASLRGTEAMALWNASCAASKAGSTTEEEAHDRRAWVLVLPLHALLLRRVAANTLLPGTVRKEESEHAAHMEAATHRALNQPLPSNAFIQEVGQVLGYTLLLHVAFITVILLASRRWPRAQEASAKSFVLDALDVIPRTAGVEVVVGPETAFVHILERMTEDPVHQAYRDMDSAFRSALVRKWRRPAISSVLVSRGSLQAGGTLNERSIAEFEARRLADIATIRLRECAWPSCDKVERTVREFKQCSGCRSVWYCSPEHHQLDWGEHRKACGELDAARRRAQTRTDEHTARDVD